MGTFERAVGCVMGVAIGDAVGVQTLDAPHPDDVPLTAGPDLTWAEPTQHLVYTGRALLATQAGPHDPAVLAGAMARQLVAWYHDPTVADRHPSRTSLGAAARLVQGTGWRFAGDPSADDADPLTRAVALGITLGPDEAVEGAPLVASVTHGHPDVSQAAAVVAWLISVLVRGASLDQDLARQALQIARTALPEAGGVRGAAWALDRLAELPGDQVARLDPHQVPPGDCGRSASSVLGLALLIALRHAGLPDGRSFEDAVVAAARLPCRSTVVAPLVGALLGAAWGTGAVPRGLVDVLEERDALIDLGRALHRAARQRPLATPDRVDTSRAWTARTPEVPERSWTPHQAATATDLEWALTETGDSTLHRTGSGIEWIVVGDEDPAEMEAEDADLHASVSRRW